MNIFQELLIIVVLHQEMEILSLLLNLLGMANSRDFRDMYGRALIRAAWKRSEAMVSLSLVARGLKSIL